MLQISTSPSVAELAIQHVSGSFVDLLYTGTLTARTGSGWSGNREVTILSSSSGQDGALLFCTSALPIPSGTVYPTNLHWPCNIRSLSYFVVPLFHCFPSLLISGTMCLSPRAMIMAAQLCNLIVPPVYRWVAVSTSILLYTCVAGITHQEHQLRSHVLKGSLLGHHGDENVVIERPGILLDWNWSPSFQFFTTSGNFKYVVRCRFRPAVMFNFALLIFSFSLINCCRLCTSIFFFFIDYL